MNLFYRIRMTQDSLRAQDQKLHEILMHRSLVARGHTFVVEYGNQFYFLVNSYDFDAATSGLPTKEIEALTEVWGVPVVEDTYKIKRVMTGVFHVPDHNHFLSRNQHAVESSA